MKQFLSALTLSAVLASSAWSEPITIKCHDVDSSGGPWVYVLDLDKKIAELKTDTGKPSIEQIEVYPKYITSNISQPHNDFFGIWVLDRDSLQMIVSIIDTNTDGSLTGKQGWKFQCVRGI